MPKAFLPRGRHAAVAAAIFLALVGCRDVLSSQGGEKKTPPEPDPGTETRGPGIHPVLVVTRQDADSATVELRLERVQVTAKVASFQGELVYGTEALTLGRAAVAQGITGASNETQPGTVRFAGVAMDGLEDGPVLTLRFATRRAPKAEDFRLSVEELVATEEFRNVTSLVPRATHPTLTRAPQH